MFLGYAENVKGYRIFDSENAKFKMTRSVKLDEREMDGIYDTQAMKPGAVIYMVKGNDEVKVQHHVDRQPVLDEPMEAVEDPVTDIEMDDVERTPSVVYHSCCPQNALLKTDWS